MRSYSKHTAQRRVKQQHEPLRVVELFAGVGGFRLGLEGHQGNKKPHHKHFKTVWFNQWEPSTSKQHAHNVYTSRFSPHSDEVREYTNKNITEVVNSVRQGEFKIPHHDLLVGGFPCQDYSVARTLSQAAGLVGKKGVLWWEIKNILEIKKNEGKPVKYLFLENVDRLLKSPVKQRGRDFAIMLASLSDLGYLVEWRVINAADYGMPQRRRRIFIVGYHRTSPIYKNIAKADLRNILLEHGTFANSFSAEPKILVDSLSEIKGDYADITENFGCQDSSPFYNAGVMHERKFYTLPVIPKHNGPQKTLSEILMEENQVPEEYFINSDIKKWKYLKGAKNEPRKGSNGFEFTYTEGPIAFPDHLDRPSRTIVTGEGGKTPSRFKHVVKTKSGRLRRLTPIELERLCMFPDEHTAYENISDIKRAFFMGNALVVGVIDKIGETLVSLHKKSLNGGKNAVKRPSSSSLSLQTTSPNRNRIPA